MWFVSLLLLMVLSYFREVLFRSLNAILDGEQEFYAKTIELDYFTEMNKAEILNYKYLFTIVFSILFISITTLGLKYSHLKSRPHILAIIIYSAFVILAALMLFISLIFSDFESFYPYLRILIGLIHNPLVFILVSISSFSLQKVDNL